jgi:hypothetical protein
MGRLSSPRVSPLNQLWRGLVVTSDRFDPGTARQIVDILKANRYDPCWTDVKDQTPFEFARSRGRSDLVDLFEKTGMDCFDRS